MHYMLTTLTARTTDASKPPARPWTDGGRLPDGNPMKFKQHNLYMQSGGNAPFK